MDNDKDAESKETWVGHQDSTVNSITGEKCIEKKKVDCVELIWTYVEQKERWDKD
jgi:hypothetical protein